MTADPNDLPDRRRWPNTRRALVLWRQELLDRALGDMPEECEDNACAGCPWCDRIGNPPAVVP